MTGQQLKNSILQMAVQGKLVPQDPNDEPASVLLERIRKEKEQLIKEGKIKKEKNPSVIFRGADNLPYEKVGKNEPVCIADEVPFEIPESWEWVRLSVVAQLLDGKKINGESHPYLEAKYLRGRATPTIKTSGKYVKKNTKVILVDGENSGEVFTLSESGYLGSTFKVLYSTSEVYTDYLLLFILLRKQFLRQNKIGAAIPHLNKNIFFSLLFPLPPYEEQIRIVEQYNTLIPFIDNYGVLENKLNILNASFPELLKKSILQEAVQGKLVPQDPNDEPASVLLERIRAEKQALIKAGKIKKDKNESVIFRRDNSHYEKRGSEEVCIDEELPFDIPSSWEWCRIGSLFQVNPRNDISDDTDVGFIPMALIKDGFRNEHTFEERKWKNIKSGFTHFADGDIVVAKITPCFQNRKSAIISQLPSGIGAGTTELHVIRDVTSMLFMPYFLLIFKTNDFIENGVKNFSGTAGQQRIGKDYISNYLVPIPPINEQVCIVDTVMKAFSNIDDLYD